MANAKIAATVGVTPVTVRSWRSRFADEGLAKFAVVREGCGRKPGITPEQIEEIVRLTQHEKPSGVQRIWSGRGLKPHLIKPLKLSNDPAFEEKLIDVVGST